LSAPELVEDFFRHEYGRLVATLVRRVGVQHLAAVEDAVQGALLTALQSWPLRGRPKQPSAWLYTVASNALVGQLRQGRRRQELLDQRLPVASAVQAPPDITVLGSEMQDDLLRLLFVCCHESLPEQTQVVLALKALCGFSVKEIAQRLLVRQASVYKRLERARARLRDHRELDDLGPAQYEQRMPAVHRIIYAVFTEGYLSNHASQAIRSELCREALRLGRLLVQHPQGQIPETFALLALMHLHAARLGAREDGAGGLVLLQDQDRSRWDAHEIAEGLQWLQRSAEGDRFCRYHAEAGIAAEHCLAPSFEQTGWQRIVQCYELLERISPSALHTLNRAVAVAEWKGPQAGLQVLAGLEPPTWLQGSYMWSAVLADLHRRCGHEAKAARYRELALDAAPSPAVRALLRRRFAQTLCD